VRLLAGTAVCILAVHETLAPHWLNAAFQDNVSHLASAIRLAAVVALAWLCPSVPAARASSFQVSQSEL